MLLVEGPALVIAWWWGHMEGKPAQPSGDPLLQLLELPSLGELWALLQRPHMECQCLHWAMSRRNGYGAELKTEERMFSHSRLSNSEFYNIIKYFK